MDHNQKRIAVLISNAGSGTNLQAIIDGVESGRISGSISLVVSDTGDAYGLERAKKHHLSSHILKPTENLTDLLQQTYPVDYVVLAGWKKIISEEFIEAFPNRILNLHPGVIPDSIDGTSPNPDNTDGLWNRSKFTEAAIKNFLDQKATYAGSSIHFLTKHFDFGPILGRCFEKIEDNDTVESLYARLKKKENELYVDVLSRLCGQNLRDHKNSVLIVGSGGREHALGWKLAQSPRVGKMYFAPGNAGTGDLGENVDIAADRVSELVAFARKNAIDLTIVGPEIPLSLGLVDQLKKHGLAVFGPTRNAARLESSKAWATDFMERFHIPHPESFIFHDVVSARLYFKSLDWKNNRIVIKADGLAAGKGVFLPDTYDEAADNLKRLMVDREFGTAGDTIIVQKRLAGQEMSLMAISDGTAVIPLLPVQDFKRLRDENEGPNTGGMGSIAPYPALSRELKKQITQTILVPTITNMRKEGNPFIGVLYAGLMITNEGPKVLEFNVRFGDPETQSLMPLLSSDLFNLCWSCVEGGLDASSVTFSDQSSACIILASAGYPGSVRKGEEITGLVHKIPSEIQIFHAGTSTSNSGIVTSGGRVLGIVARSNSISEAARIAYQHIGPDGVSFPGMQYRTDIGRMNSKSLPTATRIEVYSTVPDMRAAVKKKQLQQLNLDATINDLWLADVYTVEKVLEKEKLAEVTQALINPVVQTSSNPHQQPFSYAIEIGYLPGVTDNVGNTVQEMIGERVYSSQLLFLVGAITEDQAETIANSLYNPLIQRVHRKSYEKYIQDGGMDVVIPRVKLQKQPAVSFVDLHVPDDELIVLGKQGVLDVDGTRRGPLALDLTYLYAIRSYFDSKKRNPTDIEIESIAQTWSEHCKHTIFADPIDDIKEGLYKTFIKRATEEIRRKRTNNDICVSVFTDNSGAIIFDDQYLITDKVETHNSPSALDPFGGSVTGIVGVNRDALGFGLGAKPVINRFGFCFASPLDTSVFYRDKQRQQPLLSSKRLMEGVIAGVNNGGNCSGIPTTQGFMYFDHQYRGKPLVFVGTVGLIPREINHRLLYQKQAQPGDYVVMVGGRVGLDGIHGATFSSEALTSGSPATAVQIGDPITQKKLSDVLVKEARDLGLYTSITDNGAGGLSCSVAEMAKESGGCKVILDQVPLKYPGLEPWQIWISESQERMTVSVPKGKWQAFYDLMQRRGVEATIIGEFTESGRCEVLYQGMTIVDIEMEFLHDGLPSRPMKTTPMTTTFNDVKPVTPSDLSGIFTLMAARLNIGSIETITQQYDHDVQGGSVLKPLQGRGRVNADATVVRPVLDSVKGVVLSQGLYPSYTDIDPYAMAAASVDTAVRNAIVAGADLAHLALLDNFCWCSSTDPERLWQLKRAAEALYDTAVAYQTPIISGKDSMFNDFKGFDEQGSAVKISIPPTLLISSIGVISDCQKVVSLDAKFPGDLLYVLGETDDELGGSEYYRLLEEENGKPFVSASVPQTDTRKNKKIYEAYQRAVGSGLISSAVSIHRGGLAIALGKTAWGGDWGVDVHLSALPGDAVSAEAMLFSESQGRILVTVAPQLQTEFEKILNGVSYAKIGRVRNDHAIHIYDHDNSIIVSTTVKDGLAAYKSSFGIVYNLKPKTLVVTGYGINSEEETAYAFSLAGSVASIVHINDVIDGRVQLQDFEMMAFPGGFSFGDDTGSGNAFAQKTKNNLWEALMEYVRGDHLIIGICNGFQELVNLGLLPALEGKYGEREVALLHNDSALYTARWVDLTIAGKSPWFAGLHRLSLPIAHGEGKFYASPDILEKMKQKQLIAARYTKGQIATWQRLQPNPNGSLEDIASITDESGRILGLMPHPERAVAFTQLPNWTLLREQYKREGKPIQKEGPGLAVFKNAVRYFDS